jgi:hypothetical protein
MSGIKVNITNKNDKRDVSLDIYDDGFTIIEYDKEGNRIAEIELDKHMTARLMWKVSKYMLRYHFEQEDMEVE